MSLNNKNRQVMVVYGKEYDRHKLCYTMARGELISKNGLDKVPVVKAHDGTMYEVKADGSHHRITPKLSKKEKKLARKVRRTR
jgi:hypothetical protein